MSDPKLQQPRQPSPQPPHPQQLNIAIDESVGEGVYANLVLISHNAAEFVLDFARIMPGVPKTKVQARIVMAPQHLKGLLRALQENLEKYEARFGEIKIEGFPHEKDFGFKPSGE